MIRLVEIQDATVQVFLGELPIMEAMACKIPCLVPDYSALSEWPKGGVHYTPINRRAPWHNPNMLNTTHFFIDVDQAIENLEYLYQNKQYRDELAERGYKLVTGKEFQWKTLAKQFDTLLRNAKGPVVSTAQPTKNASPIAQVWRKS